MNPPRWKIEVGESPPGQTKRRWTRLPSALTEEPSPTALRALQKLSGEVRATSPDGSIEIVWTPAYRARRTFPLTDSGDSG